MFLLQKLFEYANQRPLPACPEEQIDDKLSKI